MKDLYEILEVSQNASQEIIEKVYRYLAKKYHPDLNPGNREQALSRMVEINRAYEILSDKNKRKNYDSVLKYEKHKNYYQDNVTKRKLTISLNKLERSIAKIIFFVSFIVIVGIILYFSANYHKHSTLTTNKENNNQAYLTDFNEARSEGLWKNGVSKERVSKVLGKSYYNNLTQQIKLSAITSKIFRSPNIKSYCSSDYMLGKDFKTLRGYVGVEDTTKNSDLFGTVVIWGDETELYRSEKLFGGYFPHKFEIDVSNVDRLSVRLEAYLPIKEVSWNFSDTIKLGIYSCYLIRK